MLWIYRNYSVPDSFLKITTYITGIVNVNWQLNADAIADFEAPHSGSLLYNVGQLLNNFTLTAKNGKL